MNRKIFYIVILLFACFSCEDIYIADIQSTGGHIVIEALITNNRSKNFVSLTKTQGFYEKGDVQSVEGASVELIDEDGNSYEGVETNPGYFKINHLAVSGTGYKLIVNAEGETYESDMQIMPAVPTIDSLYLIPETKIEYRYDYLGAPFEVERTGFTAYLDLPATDSVPRYRFKMNTLMEWAIPPPEDSNISTFGWLTNEVGGSFNISAPSQYSGEDKIKRHKLLFMSNRLKEFISDSIIDLGASMVGWIVEVDQYGMNKDSYNFYESVNGQLDAEGKLFDPVYSQLETNFTCISDPEKEVLGFFELSSYRYFRFFAMSPYGSSSKRIYLTGNRNRLPKSNIIRGILPPGFWETYN